jgi:hypothetical protein
LTDYTLTDLCRLLHSQHMVALAPRAVRSVWASVSADPCPVLKSGGDAIVLSRPLYEAATLGGPAAIRIFKQGRTIFATAFDTPPAISPTVLPAMCGGLTLHA